MLSGSHHVPFSLTPSPTQPFFLLMRIFLFPNYIFLNGQRHDIGNSLEVVSHDNGVGQNATPLVVGGKQLVSSTDCVIDNTILPMSVCVCVCGCRLRG